MYVSSPQPIVIRHSYQAVFFFYRDGTHRDLHSFPTRRSSDLKREMRLRLGKVTVADVLAAQPVTTNLLKFMRASIKMIGVSNLQSFIASMTQKLTLSDISDESKNYPKVLTSASWKRDRKSGSA